MERELAAGKITATHGLKGDVRVMSFSGEIDHLIRLTDIDLSLRGVKKKYRVESIKKAGKKLVVKLEGVDTVDEAAELTGAEIWVSRENAAPLNDGEYYLADLCGCTAEYEGRHYGNVKSVCPGSYNDLLEIERPEGETVFIPFLEVFVGTVDIEEKKIEILEDWFFS